MGYRFKKYYGEVGDPLIWKSPTALMNPTIDAGVIAAAFRDDPVAAKNEWEAEFRTDVEGFMSSEFIEGVVMPGRYELPWFC